MSKPLCNDQERNSEECTLILYALNTHRARAADTRPSFLYLSAASARPSEPSTLERAFAENQIYSLRAKHLVLNIEIYYLAK